MKKFGDFICKHKILILIISAILLIPSIYGIYKTRINYDILVYLPKDIETVQGQNLLTSDFGMGSYAISIIDNMSSKDVLKLEDKIKEIDGVNKVMSLYDIIGTTVPIEMLPSELQEKIIKGDSTLLITTFNNGTSADETLEAIENLRTVAKDTMKIGGMSAMVLDTRNLSNQEIGIYVVIAVVLCLVVLMISLDSYAVPFILLANIGIAILYNMGSNIIFGDISYITKAISSILQLGVTTDFSIFLYHKYEQAKKTYKDKDKSMSNAIKETITSVVGSSLTTVAGFLALCTMNLTLGKDIGLVMAKGVIFGVVCVITLFPSLLLFFDKLIEKTKSKPIIPEFKHIKNFVINHYKIIFVIFLLLLIPTWYGQKNTKVYYNLDSSLPSTLASSIANKDLKEDFNIVSPEIILIHNNISTDKINEMISRIKELDGIDFVLSYSSIEELGIPDDMIDTSALEMVKSNDYQLILVNSLYNTATDELNSQIIKVNSIIKEYDDKSILAGEGPLMNDLVKTSDEDFKNVNYASIAVIFVIMILVLKSISLPVILISAIEFAIFINMGIPFYTNTTIPFIASIVIGTIQLGATIDYAILMTTKYLEQRKTGLNKIDAIKIALDNSVNSIFVSGLCFFAATFGVGLYSKLEMISSLCTLISRGAIISMLVVIMVLPSLLIIFDKLICKGTIGFKDIDKKGDKKMKNKKLKTVTATMFTLALINPLNVNALTKDETVYAKLNNDGTTKKITITEHLLNDKNEKNLNDFSSLIDIKNINGEEQFTTNNNEVNFTTDDGEDIYYQGTTNDKLPLEVKATYKLDGNTYEDPTKMVGKEGHIIMTFEYVNNSREKINGYTVYTPFVVALTTTLNTSDNSNITVTNGRVESTGTNNVIAAIAAPGLYESLNLNDLKDLNYITIEYDTKSFKTNSIYQVATPKLLSEADLNKVYNKIDSLTNDVYTLQDNMNTIDDASKKLSDGTKNLLDGVIKTNTGVSSIANGAKQLMENLEKVVNSVSTLKDGSQELNTGITSIEEKINAITLDPTATQAKITQLQALETQNKNAMQTIENTLTSTTHMTMNQIGSIYANCTSNLPDEACSTATYKSLVSNYGIWYLFNMNNTTIEGTIASTIETNTMVSNLITELKGGLALLQNGSTKLTNGLSLLQSGSKELYNGSVTLTDGANTLNKGTNELQDGATTLNDASVTISDGITKFNEQGIKKITNLINSDLKPIVNKVKALEKASKNYTSIDTKSTTEGSTKIIMLIDSIK